MASQMAEDMEKSSEVTITIKCSNSDKADITMSNSVSVGELKTQIESQFKLPAAQQRLIYRGRVLNDDFTLEHYEITTGSVLHLVKGVVKKTPQASAGTTAPAQPTSAPAPSVPAPMSAPVPGPQPAQVPGANPFASLFQQGQANPFAGMAGMAGMGGMGGMGGFGDGNFNFQQMQENLMRNPEMMQNIMNSPMMESLMNNPDMMRNMMLNNPQMQAMLDANPNIRHVLNNPAVRLK
jgi:ubiquilin